MNRALKKTHRIAILGSLTASTLLIVAVAMLALQASSVRDDLNRAVDTVSTLRTQLTQGDQAGAQHSYEELQLSVSAARSTTTGVLWKAASLLPIVGTNFHAVREASVSADDVVEGGVGPLMSKYTSLDWNSLSPVDGRIDTTALAAAAPAIISASSTVDHSYERLSGIDTSGLLPGVRGPLQTLTEQLGGVRAPLRAAASAAQLLPGMLGADNERTYLLLIQNSSEARATGGIPGALAIVAAKDGRIELGAQSSATAMGFFEPAIAVQEEQVALFTGRLGNRMQNVNMTPDFPTAAATARSMWQQRYGESVDGVLALDPVVLEHLLAAAGPVSLQDTVVGGLVADTNLPIKLTSDNVASTLLADVYREIEDPALQDLYFAEVAGAVFEALTQGTTEGSVLLEALVTSVEEDRLYLWSSHNDEQKVISTTRLAGSVSGPEASGAAFGVFFNDGTGGKMDYFAERTVSVRKTCLREGTNDYTVTLDVQNTLSADDVNSLPSYVTGDGRFGVRPGHIRTNYHVYGPAHSLVESATINGESVAFGSGLHSQRPVGTVTLELQPGQSAEVQLNFTRVTQDGEPKLRVTPGVSDPRLIIEPFESVGCN